MQVLLCPASPSHCTPCDCFGHRFNPALVASRIRELSDEVAAQRMDISPIYAELLLKYASYDKGQQDR